MKKEMATPSSILARESHGQRSLVGYSPWGCKELDVNKHLTTCIEKYLNSLYKETHLIVSFFPSLFD